MINQPQNNKIFIETYGWPMESFSNDHDKNCSRVIKTSIINMFQ